MQKSCMCWVHEIPSLLKHINTSSGNYAEKAKPYLLIVVVSWWIKRIVIAIRNI